MRLGHSDTVRLSILLQENGFSDISREIEKSTEKYKREYTKVLNCKHNGIILNGFCSECGLRMSEKSRYTKEGLDSFLENYEANISFGVINPFDRSL